MDPVIVFLVLVGGLFTIAVARRAIRKLSFWDRLLWVSLFGLPMLAWVMYYFVSHIMK